MRWLPLAAFVLTVLFVVRPAGAHGMRSAYVEVTELEPGRAVLRVRTPVKGVEISARYVDGTIAVEGLGPLVPEAVVWVSRADGSTASHLVTAALPSWHIEGTPGPFELASQYVKLGVVHILTGGDHLLFLLALVLCLRRPRAVIEAETAFTASHTLSFSAAALGWLHVSSGAAEACIALSLILVALDVPTRDAPALSKMNGPALAFVFGLVHGLGFAGGLSEIGMPDQGIPVALASFAVGVELGQIAFLGIVLGAVALVARTRLLPKVSLAGAYAVGGVGTFWFFERLLVCFGPNA